MERILAIDTQKHIGKKVMIKGWVYAVRTHGKIAFIDLYDKSGLIQAVTASEKEVKQVSSLGPQDVIEVIGIVKKRDPKYENPHLLTGKLEIEIDKLHVLAKSETLPFDMGGKDLDLQLPTLLDYRSLTLRHSKIKAIFQVQAALLAGFRIAATDLGCVEIVVPTIVASSTEGGAEVFSLKYYERNAFLSQSPQLYKQMMVPIFERVWTIAHAYRAEPSVTTRHLSETTQMDCEIGFATFEELLDLLEKVATEMIKYVQNDCKDALSQYNVEKILLGKIPRLTLRQAQEIIFKEYGRDNRKEKDLTPQDETDICQWARKKHKSDFVTITHYPTKAKPFYTMPDPKDPEYSLSYDLLFKGSEILSGSQRIYEYEALKKSIKERGMNPKDFEMYLMAFRYGMPPEGGFSFGLERMTMKLLSLSNIRQASLFPRDMERVDTRLS